MKLQICIITLTLTFAGCGSSTYVTSVDQTGNLSIDGFNEKIHNDEVTILFNDGSRTSGKGFHIEHDSASWRETVSGSSFQVPVVRISTVSTSPNRFVGGLIGFGVGLGGGGLAGWRIADGSAPQGEDHGLAIAVGLIVGAGAGALVGAIVGVAIVQPTEYHFSNPKPKE